MGETLPFALWRFDNRMRLECPKRLARTVTDYFLANFLITTSGVQDDLVLDFVVRKLGVERVLFSIDYPFEDPAGAVEWLRTTSVVDDKQRRMIVRQNALNLLWGARNGGSADHFAAEEQSQTTAG
jgi:2,3-dihydroxybenzoate decarboxylase